MSAFSNARQRKAEEEFRRIDEAAARQSALARVKLEAAEKVRAEARARLARAPQWAREGIRMGDEARAAAQQAGLPYAPAVLALPPPPAEALYVVNHASSSGVSGDEHAIMCSALQTALATFTSAWRLPPVAVVAASEEFGGSTPLAGAAKGDCLRLCDGPGLAASPAGRAVDARAILDGGGAALYAGPTAESVAAAVFRLAARMLVNPGENTWWQ
jgi:hypothetical protein